MSKRIHITELSEKVIVIEYDGVPREHQQAIRVSLEDKGFYVIGASNV